MCCVAYIQDKEESRIRENVLKKDNREMFTVKLTIFCIFILPAFAAASALQQHDILLKKA